MPTNKNALIRYRVINRLLTGTNTNRVVSRKRLIEACENALDIAPISVRAIDGDISSMRNDNHLGYYAPIEYSRGHQGYYYAEPGYSIDNIPLNADEIKALVFAATTLEQFKDVSIFNEFSGAVQKIVDAVNVRRMQKDSSSYNFIEFEKIPSFKGSEHLPILIRALEEKSVIQFNYQTYQYEQLKHHTVHPIMLKEFHNRWYLIGFCKKAQKILTYGLDRISDIVSDKSIPYKAYDFDPESHFRNTFGIMVYNEPERIVLRFTRKQGLYVLSQPVHTSQEVLEETSEHTTIGLTMDINYELISLILSWGAEVEALEPVSLRNEIKERVKRMIQVYS
jgi:predicted DNA-binding transcriptional regulator YafY